MCVSRGVRGTGKFFWLRKLDSTNFSVFNEICKKERLYMASRPLSELNPGEKGTIIRIGGRGAIRRRMLDMGMVVGSEIEMERQAPLGDPIEMKIMGYHLSLRKEEAAGVQVEVLRDGDRVVSLDMATPGKPLRVLSIRGGRGLTRNLFELGLIPAAGIRVVDSQSPGRLLIEVDKARVPLGHGMAQKVLVVESP